jgi:hypothetical protein
VDKVRFKKNYENEIRELFGNPALKRFVDGKNSRFYSINKVYEIWVIVPKS